VHTLLTRPAGELDTPAQRPAPERPAPAGAALAELDVALRALMLRGTPGLHALVERRLVDNAYDLCERNQVRTARLLGISRNVLRAQLIRFGHLTRTGWRRATRPDGGAPQGPHDGGDIDA